jgi:hypothetical protein
LIVVSRSEWSIGFVVKSRPKSETIKPRSSSDQKVKNTELAATFVLHPDHYTLLSSLAYPVVKKGFSAAAASE